MCQIFIYKNEIQKWWHQLHTKLEETNDNNYKTIFLNPPKHKCHKCNHNLTLRDVRQTYAVTQLGIVVIFEKILRCRNAHCSIEGNPVTYNFWVDNYNKKHYWNNQTSGEHRLKIKSPYLNKFCNF